MLSNKYIELQTSFWEKKNVLAKTNECYQTQSYIVQLRIICVVAKKRIPTNGKKTEEHYCKE